MQKLLIKGATLWDGHALTPGDVLLHHGRVVAVGPNLQDSEADIFPAVGHLVSPGFTDLHAHLRQPGFEEKETVATGTAAALAGGFTTVCAMPNLSPVPDGPQNLQPQLAAIAEDACARVLPYGAISVGEQGGQLANIVGLAPTVAGFSDDGRGVQSEDLMRRAMQAVAAQGSFIAAHCEVESLLPKNGVCLQENCDFAKANGFVGFSNESEYAEVERNIRLCEETGCRLHICHASAAESFALVRRAKQRGLPVTCEVTPHHLILCCEDITANDGRFKMNPPLRRPEDRTAALEALLDGTADTIGTDHAPHTVADKAGGFARAACGIPGFETAFPLLYTHLVEAGKLPLETLLRALTLGPKRVLGETQHPITPGQTADLTILNLAACRLVQPDLFYTKGRSTPFSGYPLRGWPVFTIWGGHSARFPGFM